MSGHIVNAKVGCLRWVCKVAEQKTNVRAVKCIWTGQTLAHQGINLLLAHRIALFALMLTVRECASCHFNTGWSCAFLVERLHHKSIGQRENRIKNTKSCIDRVAETLTDDGKICHPTNGSRGFAIALFGQGFLRLDNSQKSQLA